MEDLERRIRDAKNYNLLLGTVTAAVGGCERLGEQSPFFGTLLECVRAQQAAFPGALSENSLHLRMLCCLALGELLSTDEDDEADNKELMVSSLLLAGLGLKPKEAGRHLDDVFDELAQVARANLQRQAVALRERQGLNWDGFKALEIGVGDPTSFNQKLLAAVRGLIEGLEREHQSDREELEVMWWLYNGYSDRLGKQLKPTTSLLAATAIGCEIADRVAPPATIG
ncbi:MAG: GTPase-associated system all-helical protein GASH, partial [Dehalococcoidia bacterium]